MNEDITSFSTPRFLKPKMSSTNEHEKFQLISKEAAQDFEEILKDSKQKAKDQVVCFH